MAKFKLWNSVMIKANTKVIPRRHTGEEEDEEERHEYRVIHIHWPEK